MAITGASARGHATHSAKWRVALAIARTGGIRRVLLAVGAGGVMALSLPPLGLWPALLLGMGVLIWLLDGVSLQSGALRARLAAAFLTGWSLGFGYFVISLYWVGVAFLVDAEQYALMMPIGVAVLPAGLALLWGLASAAVMPLWQASGLSRAILLAVALAVGEWLRGYVLTGFPWNAPGYVAGALDGLAQAAALIGVHGLSFLMLLWAAVAAVLVTERLPRRAFLAALGVLALAPMAWAAGTWRLANADDAAVPGVLLRIVQPNIPQSDKWRAERRDEIIKTYEQLSRAAGADRVTHIVWPESALPVLVDETGVLRARLARLLPDNALLLLGALRREPAEPADTPGWRVFNSILAMNASGETVARYDKWRLVPFGEYLPLAGVLEPLGLRKLVPIPLAFSSGNGPATLSIDGTPPFAPLVCYEAIFPRSLIDRQTRPEWLLNLTNDGWFGMTAGPYQHLEQARFRAIEEGLPLVRAANTGISAVIDPYGRIMQSLPLGVSGVLDAALPRPLSPTLYARFGNRPLAVLLFSALLLGWALRRGASSRITPNSQP